MTRTPEQLIIATARSLQFHNSNLSWSEALNTARSLVPKHSTNPAEMANTTTDPVSRTIIQDGVQDLMRREGISYDAAWNLFARQNPQFANAMTAPPMLPGIDAMKERMAAQQQAATERNDSCSFLTIPLDASDEELDAAKSGNGGRTSGALNADAVFLALAKLYAKKNNLNLQAAKTYALGRLQKLTRLCKPETLGSDTVHSSEGKGTSPDGTSRAPSPGIVPPVWPA